jgi:uracil-DNA glycosylase family 4
MSNQIIPHFCNSIEEYDLNHLLQIGIGSKSKILIVGESPALNGWILSGRAFYTDKGKLVPSGVRLNKLFAPFNFQIEECSFTEICKCLIGKDRKLLKVCGNKCWPIFKKQVGLVKPEIIITLGVETLKIFNTNLERDIKIGSLEQIELIKRKIHFLPIYHPSPVNPKSQKWNEEIMGVNKSEVNGIISALSEKREAISIKP